jgi:hypothetical protein
MIHLGLWHEDEAIAALRQPEREFLIFNGGRRKQLGSEAAIIQENVSMKSIVAWRRA